jgi:hypothetical protein
VGREKERKFVKREREKTGYEIVAEKRINKFYHGCRETEEQVLAWL